MAKVLRCKDVVKRIPFKGMVPAFMVIALILFPLLASADEDPCHETGIYMANQTMDYGFMVFTEWWGMQHICHRSPYYHKTGRYAHYLQGHDLQNRVLLQ